MINGVKLLTATEAVMQTEKPDLIPSQHIDLMWSTLVTGLVVVFLILIILVIFLWALGKVMAIKAKPKTASTPNETQKPAPAEAQTASASAEEIEPDEDDDEIIAVIAAVVAAYGEAEGKQYKIASVKKREKAVRSNWSAAGIAENTKSF